MNFKLSAPGQIVFLISVALAVIVLLGRLGLAIPTIGISSFNLLAIAYVVLLVGVLVKGA